MYDNLTKYKVKRKFRDDIEPEEIFMDSSRLKESPESDREKLEKPIKENILKIFFASIVIILTLFLLKSFDLQIIKGNYWQELSDENRIRSYPIKPLRGIVYDKNMVPLAINVPKLDLVISPVNLIKNENFNQIIEKIALTLEKPKEEIEKKIRNNANLSYPIIIEEDISLEKALLLESKFSDTPEIGIRKDSRREYESGPVFAHVLGYLGKVNQDEISDKNYFLDDYIGREGAENTYEDILRGFYGEELIEVDNIGKIQKILATKDPVNGQDLVLSIDAELQKQIYNLLKAKLNTLSVSRAAAVAVNPQNGKILALVSLPGFDNNEFIKGLSEEEFKKIYENTNKPFLNRAIMGLYPPGSTIKPLVASAALQEGIVNQNKQINCPGQIRVVDKYNPNVFWTYNDWKAHGTVDINKAIAESCDVFFYTIGGGYGDIEGLGIENIKKYLNFFGWGKMLGIDLPGEQQGFVPDATWKEETKKEDWYIGDTYNVSIGQGDLSVSPLQVTMAIAAVANGGKVYEPQVINDKTPRIISRDFIKEEYLEIVRKGMREAVISGSARILADLPIKAAGKTGTAQVSKTKSPHSWFTVFAPYENPQIVLTILVENGGEGSSVATPIAKEVLNWYFSK